MTGRRREGTRKKREQEAVEIRNGARELGRWGLGAGRRFSQVQERSLILVDLPYPYLEPTQLAKWHDPTSWLALTCDGRLLCEWGHEAKLWTAVSGRPSRKRHMFRSDQWIFMVQHEDQ